MSCLCPDCPSEYACPSEKEVDALRAEVAALREDVGKLYVEREDAIRELENVRADFIVRVRDLERDLATARAEVAALESTLKQANQNSEHLMEMVNETSRDLATARALLAECKEQFWSIRMDYSDPREGCYEMETRIGAFLNSRRDDCDCIPEGARLKWNHVESCPAYVRDEAPIPTTFICPKCGADVERNPKAVKAHGCVTFRARDEARGAPECPEGTPGCTRDHFGAFEICAVPRSAPTEPADD